MFDAGAVFSLSFPPTALATDLSKEDRGFEDDDAFCCSDAEVAAAGTGFAVLEGEGFSLIFNGPRNSQLPIKLVKGQGILQDHSISIRRDGTGRRRESSSSSVITATRTAAGSGNCYRISVS